MQVQHHGKVYPWGPVNCGLYKQVVFVSEGSTVQFKYTPDYSLSSSLEFISVPRRQWKTATCMNVLPVDTGFANGTTTPRKTGGS